MISYEIIFDRSWVVGTVYNFIVSALCIAGICNITFFRYYIINGSIGVSWLLQSIFTFIGSNSLHCIDDTDPQISMTKCVMVISWGPWLGYSFLISLKMKVNHFLRVQQLQCDLYDCYIQVDFHHWNHTGSSRAKWFFTFPYFWYLECV